MKYQDKLENFVHDWFDDERKNIFVSQSAAGILLGVSSSTVSDLIKRKKINYICLKGKIYVPFNTERFFEKNLVVNVDALENLALSQNPDDLPYVVQ